MAHTKVFAICENKCFEETMIKEDILKLAPYQEVELTNSEAELENGYAYRIYRNGNTNWGVLLGFVIPVYYTNIGDDGFYDWNIMYNVPLPQCFEYDTYFTFKLLKVEGIYPTSDIKIWYELNGNRTSITYTINSGERVRLDKVYGIVKDSPRVLKLLDNPGGVIVSGPSDKITTTINDKEYSVGFNANGEPIYKTQNSSQRLATTVYVDNATSNIALVEILNNQFTSVTSGTITQGQLDKIVINAPNVMLKVNFNENEIFYGQLTNVVDNNTYIFSIITNDLSYSFSIYNTTFNITYNVLRSETTPTEGSDLLITSGGVKEYVDTRMGDVITILSTLNSGNGVA